jgi:hypothetical protein
MFEDFPTQSHFCDESQAFEFIVHLKARGYDVCCLDGTAFSSEASFFQEAGKAFGFFPPDNWIDLYQRFESSVLPLDAPTIILWRNADISLQINLSLGINIFRHLNNLTEPAYRTLDDLEICKLFLSGTGEGFSEAFSGT